MKIKVIKDDNPPEGTIVICSLVEGHDLPTVPFDIDQCKFCGSAVYRSRSSPQTCPTACVPCAMKEIANLDHAEVEFCVTSKTLTETMVINDDPKGTKH